MLLCSPGLLFCWTIFVWTFKGFVLIQSSFISVVSGVAYWLFGYAFAYGDGNSFIGHNNFASSYLPDTEFASFFFQYTFAATAATIVSGAVAERCEFMAYFVYSFFITGNYVYIRLTEPRVICPCTVSVLMYTCYQYCLPRSLLSRRVLH